MFLRYNTTIPIQIRTLSRGRRRGTAGFAPRKSIVEFRGMPEAVKGRQIMIDPQCGVFLGDDFGEQSMRGVCLLSVGIYRWHAIVIPIVFEMRGIASQHDPAGVAEMHQQWLMSRSVAGSRE